MKPEASTLEREQYNSHPEAREQEQCGESGGRNLGIKSEHPDNRQTTAGITLSAEVSNVNEKQTNLKQITLFLSFLLKRTMEI